MKVDPQHRFLLKDQITGSFYEDILDELGEDSTTSFIIDALKRFDTGSSISTTGDGYHYSNAFTNVSGRLGIRLKRQRCLFHIVKRITKSI